MGIKRSPQRHGEHKARTENFKFGYYLFLVVPDKLSNTHKVKKIVNSIKETCARSFMMSDLGVVLLVSTGMISRAGSDDELLGYAAHEVGHEFFASYSIYSNHLLRLISDRGKEPVLSRHMIEVMAIIELQCDAFAALTLASLGYNPSAFADGLDRTRHDYPNAPFGNHPSEKVRRDVIQRVVPPSVLTIKPRVSANMQLLRKLISDT